MNENADKHLDNLARKVIGKSAIESPSFDFTNTVMSQIKQLSTSKVTTYVPLISKRVWFIVAIAIIGVIVYSIFGSSTADSGLLDKIGMERFSNLEFNNPLGSLDISPTVIYSVLLFIVMLCIQIPFLKHYFDKRFEA
ncbi:hypothetical protein [uncultured Psychroserpens sp.]|uniref:hypothetical protein n=1 Tax=uncultured Psychroserpens sp. TaxID=255436 RepID=UPI002620BA32|nr:hypothetical protein [uncultured Psychroserpens sp.]